MMIETPTPMRTLNLGFLGLGWIGRNRMQAILEDFPETRAKVYDPAEENSRSALEVSEKITSCNSPEEIYGDPAIDGVVIATPSALHASQAIEAFSSGKAVFCQKPLGRTAEEARAVVAASRKASKLLSVDLSYRYTKAFEAIYHLIHRGDIGDIFAVDLTFHNAYGPDKEWFYDLERSGGGCVMDLGVHLVDLALWTLNFPKIQEVNSQLFQKGRKLNPKERTVEDFANITMTSASSTLINLQCSWKLPAGQDAVIAARFYGTKGGAAFKNINGSFYDFVAEKYSGTSTEILVDSQDDWGGRAGKVWAKNLLTDNKFHPETAEEFIRTAEIIDRIYER